MFISVENCLNYLPVIGLANQGKRVLLIDADQQASMSVEKDYRQLLEEVTGNNYTYKKREVKTNEQQTADCC